MSAVSRSPWAATLDVLFPPVCVECEAVVEGGGLRHVCVECEKRLHLVHEPACPTCGHPFYGELSEGRLCEHCETLVPEFDHGRTAVLLRGPGRALVHALKYHDSLHVLDDVVALMRRAPGYAAAVEGKVLVPVPLHPRKLRERGYNQSRLLAECAVRAADGRAKIEELLVRRIDTVSQTLFDRAARQANLKNAFALAPGAVITPGHHYLLIDDVFTTGSTLNACAAVLRNAGALNLDVITFGHG